MKTPPPPAIPFDIWLLIYQMRARDRNAVVIQSAWRGHRLRTLMTRFKCLRFLKTFREWNPTAEVYLKRCALVW